MVNPDFVALAKAMHCHAIRCDSLADLPAKMKEFMEYDNNKPILMDARTVKTEHVYPMVRYYFSSPMIDLLECGANCEDEYRLRLEKLCTNV